MFSHLKVGDSVYIRDGISADYYTKAQITKVTPKGLIDVLVGQRTIRFRPNGDELGEERYYRKHLDKMPVEERDRFLVQRERIKIAANAINEVKLTYNVQSFWDKASLLKAVEELEEKLVEARKLTENV